MWNLNMLKIAQVQFHYLILKHAKLSHSVNNMLTNRPAAFFAFETAQRWPNSLLYKYFKYVGVDWMLKSSCCRCCISYLTPGKPIKQLMCQCVVQGEYKGICLVHKPYIHFGDWWRSCKIIANISLTAVTMLTSSMCKTTKQINICTTWYLAS